MLSRSRQPRPRVPADPRAGAIIAAVILSCVIVNAASHAIGLSFIAGAYLAIGIVAAVAAVWLSFMMWREGHELFALRSIWPLPLLFLWISGFPAINEWAAATNPVLFEAARGLGRSVPSQFMPWWGTTWFKFAGIAALVGGRAFQFWRKDGF